MAFYTPVLSAFWVLNRIISMTGQHFSDIILKLSKMFRSCCWKNLFREDARKNQSGQRGIHMVS